MGVPLNVAELILSRINQSII